MASDPKRVDQVLQHIRRIKMSDYPVIVGNHDAASGGYRIVERPWKELAEPSKLAILQDAVDWSSITNQDRAMILLSQIDPGKITNAQRSALIDMAVGQDSYEDRLRQAAAIGGRDKDKGIER